MEEALRARRTQLAAALGPAPREDVPGAASTTTSAEVQDHRGDHGVVLDLMLDPDGLCFFQWEGQRLARECVGRSTILATLVAEVDAHRTKSSIELPFIADAFGLWIKFSADEDTPDHSEPAALCHVLQVLPPHLPALLSHFACT